MTLREALLRGRRRPRRFGAGSPTTYRGDGYEFVELREYVPGDDVRRIDWAATARAGGLQTRVVLEDVALTLAAAIDDSASMKVGRRRTLLDAANDAQAAWFGAARGGDRTLRLPLDGTFALAHALAVANALLPPGAALLIASDWYDLDASVHDLLARLGTRCDCTALVARDPWYEALPLSGFVRMQGAEGGHARLYIGKRERAAFATAVREREAGIASDLASLGWRAAPFDEHNGERSLLEAFGVEYVAR